MARNTGPFGFEKGMTPQQVIQLVGKDAVVKVDDNIITFKTAPKPHPNFTEYMLLFSPTDGLLKLLASTRPIQTGDAGSEVREVFNDIVNGVGQKYGPPTKAFDRCGGNDTECDNSQFWMLSLKDKNRTLIDFWEVNTPINGVTLIIVEAVALRVNSGYIQCSFEFSGFNEYTEAKKRQKNNNY